MVDILAGFILICRHACDIDTCWDVPVQLKNVVLFYFARVCCVCFSGGQQRRRTKLFVYRGVLRRTNVFTKEIL